MSVRYSSLGRYRCSVGEDRSELAPVEAVDPGIGQVVGPLLFAAIAVLDDGGDMATGIGKDAPVAGWVIQPRGQQGHGRLGVAVALEQCGDRLFPQQRYVPIEDQKFTLKVRQGESDCWTA